MLASLKEKINIDELFARFMGMNSKERGLTIGVISLALILLVFVPLGCATSKLGQMETQIINHEKNVDEILDKIRELKTLESKDEALAKSIKPKSQVKLKTMLAGISNKMGIELGGFGVEKEKKVGDDFADISIDLKVNRLTIGQVTELLFNIENHPVAPMHVVLLSVTPNHSTGQTYDLDLKVSSLVSVGEQ